MEIAPGIGLADVICDLASTGSTLLTNGLREVETVLQSQAVLVKPQQLAAEKETLPNRLLFRIEAVQQASRDK